VRCFKSIRARALGPKYVGLIIHESEYVLSEEDASEIVRQVEAALLSMRWIAYEAAKETAP
jgi:divalent metal cation (Fe/Co/Zn/Cd) transporter